MSSAHKDVTLFSLDLNWVSREESVERARRMAERNEDAIAPVNLAASEGGENWVLSPIADFTTDDIFAYLGQVRSGQIRCYDNFDALVEVYRDMNGGDCMVLSYLSGADARRRPGCGARTGCWTCLRVTGDASAENMIAKQGGEYSWLKPLNDLRSYMKARHFDPSARCWLSRQVDERTGRIKISPNAYSPAYTLELLRLILTIQIQEEESARQLGIKPRFTVLSMRQIVAIDMLWGRYGYHKPFMALRTYLEIYEQDARYPIPDISNLPTWTEKDVAFRAEAVLCDEFYGSLFDGLRSLDHAVAGAESLTVTRQGKPVTDVVTTDEFAIDEEGLELFLSLELDHALNRVSLDAAPSSAVHYLLGLGTVSLSKGGHAEWSRMLRLSNQIWRFDLIAVLHDPLALIERLNLLSQKKGDVPMAAKCADKQGQLDLFTC